MSSSNLLTEKRLRTLKGVGDKTEKLFGRVGIGNLDQLVHYYPRAYDVFSDCVPIGRLAAGEKQAVRIPIKNPPVVKSGGRVPVTVLNAADDTGKLEIVWFNMPYLRSVLKPGSVFVFRGMVAEKNGKRSMEHPEMFSPEAYEKMQGSIQPVYALTAGLKNRMVARAVEQVLDAYSFLEYLPETLCTRYRLADRDTAVNRIHFPQDAAQLREARRRIVFDEFLFYLLRLGRITGNPERPANTCPVSRSERTDALLHSLPFSLTAAQEKVWKEIRADISSECTMNRLLQGDVGSGKTILAFLAMTAFWESGYQCAMMAPTEVLAAQHYASFLKLPGRPVPEEQILLLTGSLSAKEKREAYEKTASGAVRIVIGTHAIIQERVAFRNLALVVTDEQHRFGVRQREMITEKGSRPHVLVMSATPIPRTLALILYGDLHVSVLDEMPADRLKIKNCVVDPSWRKTAYSFIRKELGGGHQAYVICPMIEPNEDLGCENVLEYTKKLKKLFPAPVRVEMLHGRMTAREKQEIMQAFAANKIQILVSTTVVEVGVDVPNATVMLIENAERFGLAQLHQLRGRIGRGSAQSFCIFMQGNSAEESGKRLEILNRSCDGFEIAEEDLKLRGQGDLFGLRQSGEAGFALADPFADSAVLEEASAAARRILAEDPALSSDKYAGLARMLEQTETGMESVL